MNKLKYWLDLPEFAVATRMIRPILIIILFILVYTPTIVWLWKRWMMGVWYNAHGVLVPFISCYLIYLKLRDARDETVEQGDPLGFLLLIPALLLHIIDTSLWSQILSALSLVPAILGIFFLFFGRSFALKVWIPISLLLFMIPVPSAVSQPILIILRRLSAIGTEALIQGAGCPVLRTDTVLMLPNAFINIGDPCSGFATLCATILFTGTILYLWYPGPVRAFLLVIIAFFVAVFANVLRCSMLSFMVLQYEVEILQTFVHPLSGYIAYFIAIGMQSLFLFFLKRKES